LAALRVRRFDAIACQLTEEESGTIVIVQNWRPDSFFSAERRDRLAVLMSRWRQARDAGRELVPDDRSELEALVGAEEGAATKRAEAISDESGL